jgi:hypothetical protein
MNSKKDQKLAFVPSQGTYESTRASKEKEVNLGQLSTSGDKRVTLSHSREPDQSLDPGHWAPMRRLGRRMVDDMLAAGINI